MRILVVLGAVVGIASVNVVIVEWVELLVTAAYQRQPARISALSWSRMSSVIADVHILATLQWWRPIEVSSQCAAVASVSLCQFVFAMQTRAFRSSLRGR